ncbi:metallopeptidase TldD-related protein [Clostridium polynesiense]|uniref:metallopeptidase TldD-related protein n=1 Tax=Clostridium polynesiense TaxID=1325933 RepID=UPI0005908271|nr:metallopeptidase TldD-related protein [Clostridium polynesiense]
MRDSYLSIDLLFNDKSIAGLEGFFWEVQSRDYSRENLLKEFDMLCRAYRNKLTLPKEGKMPVVFIDMDSMPLMKFHTDLNGLWVGSGTSIFSKDIGSKRFSDYFTLYATRNPQDGIHTFFDGEGVINENYRYTLIEDGVIKAPYTDKRTASRFNLPLTGSAGCTYDSAPRLDVPSLKIKESGKTVKELLGGEKGILVVTASGGDFTPEGNFATPVQVPILFDGENMLGMLPNLQISGSVYDMFGGGFRGVSTDYINPTQKFKAMVMEMNVTRL